MHFVFTHGALHAARDQLHAACGAISRMLRWTASPLTGAFGQHRPWACSVTPIGAAGAVDSCVRSFLVAAWAAREAAVAARELDAGPELLVEPEPDPAVACVRVRACNKWIRDTVAAEPELMQCAHLC